MTRVALRTAIARLAGILATWLLLRLAALAGRGDGVRRGREEGETYRRRLDGAAAGDGEKRARRRARARGQPREKPPPPPKTTKRHRAARARAARFREREREGAVARAQYSSQEQHRPTRLPLCAKMVQGVKIEQGHIGSAPADGARVISGASVSRGVCDASRAGRAAHPTKDEKPRHAWNARPLHEKMRACAQVRARARVAAIVAATTRAS